MNHAHVEAGRSLKTAVVTKEAMWVLEAAKTRVQACLIAILSLPNTPYRGRC